MCCYGRATFRAPKSLLLDQGYRSRYAAAPAGDGVSTLDYGAAGKTGACLIVELHAILSPRAFPFDLDLPRLAKARAASVTLMGQPLVAPGAEDLLLILCMHGAKHLWKNLNGSAMWRNCYARDRR